MNLHDFTLGDDVGGVGKNLHDAHLPSLDHDLEGARVQEIAHQDAGWVTKRFICCGAAATQSRGVHHIIVQQCGCVNEFDHSCQIEALRSLVAECAADQ